MGALWGTFESRLRLTARLVARTGLRIGMGTQSVEPTASDLPIMKTPDEQPFIPGSSLRGVIRSHVERIVRTFEPTAASGRGACSPVGEPCVTDKQRDAIRDEVRKRKGDARAYAQGLFDACCRVCQVFGCPWVSSRVRITDLPCLNGAKAELRDGVAIDREKETVAQKYDFETVPQGSAFQLELIAENLDRGERGLLWLGIAELRRGQILVGGFKGRGLGRVGLEEARVELVEGRDALRRYLLEGTMRIVPDPEVDGWLEEAVKAIVGGKG